MLLYKMPPQVFILMFIEVQMFQSLQVMMVMPKIERLAEEDTDGDGWINRLPFRSCVTLHQT